MEFPAPARSAIGLRLLGLLPPESAHRAAHLALRFGLVRPQPSTDEPGLRTTVFGIDFQNPLGIAPGFDKHGEVIAESLAQGAGFIEIGGVTPRPQPGNPKPRLFRLGEDAAIINRMGFNSEGAEAVRRRLAAFREEFPRGQAIVGVNLAKNRESTDAAADYIAGIDAFSEFADFLVVNVSSPNTPGLRNLQSGDNLQDLLHRLAEHRQKGARVPMLLKVAPDLTGEQRSQIAAAALERTPGEAPAVDGLVVGNTSVGRPASLRSRNAGESGGLSGRPIFALSTEVLGDFYRLTEGRVPLIGVGGIASGEDAYRKIRAGASLVQLYTALVYQGPALLGRIKRDLAARLRADGYASVAEAVGADHRVDALGPSAATLR